MKGVRGLVDASGELFPAAAVDNVVTSSRRQVCCAAGSGMLDAASRVLLVVPAPACLMLSFRRHLLLPVACSCICLAAVAAVELLLLLLLPLQLS